MPEALAQPEPELIDLVGAELELALKVLLVALVQALDHRPLHLQHDLGRLERRETLDHFFDLELALQRQHVDVHFRLVPVQTGVTEVEGAEHEELGRWRPAAAEFLQRQGLGRLCQDPRDRKHQKQHDGPHAHHLFQFPIKLLKPPRRRTTRTPEPTHRARRASVSRPLPRGTHSIDRMAIARSSVTPSRARHAPDSNPEVPPSKAAALHRSEGRTCPPGTSSFVRA